MISNLLDTHGELVAWAMWSVTCWVSGVVYAIYRAVGWVERMRAWAHTVVIEEEVNQ